MDTQPTENLKKEPFPFRKLSTVSYLKGGISIVLGIMLLFLVKTDLEQKNFLLVFAKMSSAIGFLTIGIRSIWRGYKNEYDFSLKDIFDPSRSIEINYLLGQRSLNKQKNETSENLYKIANEHVKIFRSKNFSFTEKEKGDIKDWQFIFYKIVSKKGFADIFEYIPFPITKFISNQSKPVSLIGFFIFILIVFGFLTYLGIISFSMIWINLFILIGLLTLWQPSKIDYVVRKDANSNTRKSIFYFLFFYVITILLYKPYNGDISLGLLVSFFALAGIIIYTAFISFKLIEGAFENRKQIHVQTSNIDLTTHRVATQPSNIEQQFENVISRKTGWYFKSSTLKKGGVVTGDQIHKGSFEYEYIYETNPEIVSTTYDKTIENRLSMIYKIGSVLICLGLVVFFFGILKFPSINYQQLTQNTDSSLLEYSPKILFSLFLILFSTALYFFGNRLIYEIYMFFNTEIFFESNLILFKAKGNYDEFEHITGGMKRKDTFTDFTPDIEVCKVTSSMFVHPYLNSSEVMHKLPRFVTNVNADDDLLNSILDEFKKNLAPYLMSFQDRKFSDQEIREGDNNDLIEG